MVALAATLVFAFLQGGEQAPLEIPIRPQFFIPPSYGPMLANLTMRVKVIAKSRSTGTVTFPIPSDYSGQSLFGFQVQTEPVGALKSWHCETRPDGLNRLLKADIDAASGEVTVMYIAQMLVPGYEVIRTQVKGFNSWLGATSSIEADAPQIIEVSKHLQEGKPSRADFVSKTVRWVAKNHFTQTELLENSDAVSAFEHGGDSLARSNLCAAILRAAKIPARVVAQAPNWAERIEASTWGIQYEAEDGVWDMAQPISGIAYPVRNSIMVLSISSRRDESHSLANPLALRPDAPTLSTPEISSELRWAPSNGTIRHTTLQVVRNFPRSTGARLMPAGFRRSQLVFADAKVGKPNWVDEAILKKVLVRGPINLALYLDGQPTMPNH